MKNATKTWEDAKREGAIEALDTIDKWRIIGETLPNVMTYSGYLKDKIKKTKEKYQ